MSSPNLVPEVARTSDRGARAWLGRHGESCLFWSVALAHIIPIWAFVYVPTQDGPMHVSSAIIFKDYGAAGTRYHEFFELRFEPNPNWMVQLLLAALMFVAPPLIAEKLLVSGYILVFAAALRCFYGTFGPRTRPLALAGLLLLFNRCLWLGFYNFVLSLALWLFVLGFWL